VLDYLLIVNILGITVISFYWVFGEREEVGLITGIKAELVVVRGSWWEG
jgi:hypothetical protein